MVRKKTTVVAFCGTKLPTSYHNIASFTKSKALGTLKENIAWSPTLGQQQHLDVVK